MATLADFDYVHACADVSTTVHAFRLHHARLVQLDMANISRWLFNSD